MTIELSSLVIGCLPPARSMIDRRREASATGPSTYSPASSGPRWCRARLMASRAEGSAGVLLVVIMPAIPHILLSDLPIYVPVLAVLAALHNLACRIDHQVNMAGMGIEQILVGKTWQIWRVIDPAGSSLIL